jgi:hypothetical protein
MTTAFASFSGFHGDVTLHCHWKYSLLALLQPCSGGVSLQNFAQNRLNCEYVTHSRQISSTRIAKHRSFIKLKFLQNFCSSCKTLADQVARNPRFYCTMYVHRNGEDFHLPEVHRTHKFSITYIFVHRWLFFTVVIYTYIQIHFRYSNVIV